MKINDLQTIHSTAVSKTAPHNPQKAESLDFRDMLSQAVDRNQADSAADNSGAAPIAPAVPVAPIRPLSSESGGSIAERAERMLDTLERYRHQLAEPGRTLREIEPTVKRIESRQQELNAMLEQLPPSDPLQGILNELMVTASIEVAKFNRGDYV